MINSSFGSNSVTSLRLDDWCRASGSFAPNFYRRYLIAKFKSIRSIYAPLTCLYLEFIPGLMLIMTIIGYILISSGEIKLPWDEQLSTAEKTARSNAGIVSSFILLGLVWCGLHTLFLDINARQIRAARAAQMTSTVQLLLHVRRRLWAAPFGAKNLRRMAAQELSERAVLERSVDETYLNGLSTVAIFRNIQIIFIAIFSLSVLVSGSLLSRFDQRELLLVYWAWGAAIFLAVLHIVCMCVTLPLLCSQKHKQSFALAKINVRSQILTICFAPFNWVFINSNLY